jgi:hypothetical protein
VCSRLAFLSSKHRRLHYCDRGGRGHFEMAVAAVALSG